MPQLPYSSLSPACQILHAGQSLLGVEAGAMSKRRKESFLVFPCTISSSTGEYIILRFPTVELGIFYRQIADLSIFDFLGYVGFYFTVSMSVLFFWLGMLDKVLIFDCFQVCSAIRMIHSLDFAFGTNDAISLMILSRTLDMTLRLFCCCLEIHHRKLESSK